MQYSRVSLSHHPHCASDESALISIFVALVLQEGKNLQTLFPNARKLYHSNAAGWFK